jgi:DNA repair exonuclease SbcCD nuclease subunit
MASWAARCAEAGVSMWLIDGNHDVAEDGHGSSTLTPLEGAFGQLLTSRQRRFVHVVKKPAYDHFGGCDLVFLPFPSLATSYDPTEAIAAHARTWDGKRPVLVVGHLQVAGARMASETYDMPRGRDVGFPSQAIAGSGYGSRILAVNGHYHRAQEIQLEGLAHPLLVPGAPERFTFGEHDHEPSFLEISVRSYSDGSVPHFAVARAAAKSIRPMHRVTAETIASSGSQVIPKKLAEGALVRIEPPSDATPALVDQLRKSTKGAAGVVFGAAPKVRRTAELSKGKALDSRKVALDLARKRGGEELAKLVSDLLDEAEAQS